MHLHLARLESDTEWEWESESDWDSLKLVVGPAGSRTCEEGPEPGLFQDWDWDWEMD
jgi:hypothetical protein